MHFYLKIIIFGKDVRHSIFDKVNFVSFDFKTPSTGVTTNIKLLEKVIYHGLESKN